MNSHPVPSGVRHRQTRRGDQEGAAPGGCWVLLLTITVPMIRQFRHLPSEPDPTFFLNTDICGTYSRVTSAVHEIILHVC